MPTHPKFVFGDVFVTNRRHCVRIQIEDTVQLRHLETLRNMLFHARAIDKDIVHIKFIKADDWLNHNRVEFLHQNKRKYSDGGESVWTDFSKPSPLFKRNASGSSELLLPHICWGNISTTICE